MQTMVKPNQGPNGPKLFLSLSFCCLVSLYMQVWIVSLLISLTTLLCFFNVKITRVDEYSSNSKSINSILPRVKWFPVRVPIIEGLITLIKLRTGGVEFPKHLTDKYGPTFKADFGLGSVVFTSDPDYIQAVLSSSNPDHLNKPADIYNALLTTAFQDGLFAAPYSTWIKHRRAVSPAFTYKAMLNYLKIINESSQKFIERVERHSDKHGVIYNRFMKEELDILAVTVTSQIILGPDNSTLTEAQQNLYHKAFSAFKNATLERFTNPEQMIPFVWLLHPNKRRLEKSIDEMYEHVQKLILNYRSKDVAKANRSNDIVDFSLDAFTDSEYYESLKQTEKFKPESETGVKQFVCLLEHLLKSASSNKEIVDEVTTFMMAGYETLAMTMEMILFNLACNQEAQKRCQEEVEQLILEQFPDESGTPCFTMEHLSKLKYLERCVLESLRLTPSVPIILRRLESPLRVNSDSYFEGGETIGLYIWGVHRNPEIYPEPEKFDPDRFLPEAVKARHSHAFLPFSLGSRNCIGWKLALLELKIILAKLVYTFDFWTTDKPNDVKLDFHITIKPERTHNVYFRRRVKAL